MTWMDFMAQFAVAGKKIVTEGEWSRRKGIMLSGSRDSDITTKRLLSSAHCDSRDFRFGA